MATRILIGVDLGTTSAKGVAVDLAGRALAAADVSYAHAVPAPGWAEADAGGWWRATRAILGRLRAAVPRGRVEGVGITGQAPTLLPVDRAGTPLRPAILWLDARAAGEAEALRARLGAAGEARAGNRLHAYFLGPKLAWLRAHEPGIWAATATVLQSHSYPVLRLTGARVTDYSSAALCAPLYDARRRCWADEACAALDLDPRRLPDLAPAHAPAGALTAEAARETALPRGTPVVVGGADFAASTLAAGVMEPGEACLMLGTAGNLIAPLVEPRFDTRLVNAHHVGCDRYLALGATLAGAALGWFADTCAGGVSLDALDAEAAAVPPGAEGVRVVPYLQGERTPLWDAAARGAVTGLSLAHGRGHLWRAVLEGVAVSLRHCLEVLREQGLAVHEIVAVNGGARSAVWRQILCDALGAPLVYLPASPGAPAGAALLAGLGAGVLPEAAVARGWRGEATTHRPDPGRTALYGALLAERLALYPALRAGAGGAGP
jgi:xylulokinase